MENSEPKTRRIILKGIRRNIFLDVPEKAAVTATPIVPMQIRIYDKAGKGGQLLAVITGIIDMHEQSVSMDELPPPKKDVEEREQQLQENRLVGVQPWRTRR